MGLLFLSPRRYKRVGIQRHSPAIQPAGDIRYQAHSRLRVPRDGLDGYCNTLSLSSCVELLHLDTQGEWLDVHKI